VPGLEERDVVFVVQLDDCLLPALGVSEVSLVSSGLAVPLLSPHGYNPHVKQLLDRLPDLLLARLMMHLEGVGIEVIVLGLLHALFGHDRSQDDLVGFQVQAASAARGVRGILGG
jgi:hypothetical protein